MSVDQIPQILRTASPIARAALAGLRHRGQLATLEATEARDHLLVTLVFAVVAAVLLLVTLFTGTLAIAALVWDLPNRVTVLSLLALGYLAVALAAGGWILRRMRRWQPLAESRRQLDADCQWLEELLPLNPSSNE